MKQYHDFLNYIIQHGDQKDDRTGVGTMSIFGYQMKFNLQHGFPLLTTKKVHLKSIIHELLWFLSGNTNIEYLRSHNVNIWNEWADANGDLGPVYGAQWRSWGKYLHSLNVNEANKSIISNEDNHQYYVIDQITAVIKEIKTNPNSRRLIVSSWNVAELPYMAIMPCHALFQFYVNSNKLSCHLYQRSADAFLGVPFNIASYALLTMMIAQVCNLDYGDFIHSFGDAHIYNNHIEQVSLQLTRTPKALPQMIINKDIDDIYNFKYEDFILCDYDPYPLIKAPIAV